MDCTQHADMNTLNCHLILFIQLLNSYNLHVYELENSQLKHNLFKTSSIMSVVQNARYIGTLYNQLISYLFKL